MRTGGFRATAALGLLLAAGAFAPSLPGAADRTEAREGQQAPRGGDKAPGQRAVDARMAALRAIYGGRGGSPLGGYLNRAGWTNRRYQRAALKARNVRRNRAAHR